MLFGIGKCGPSFTRRQADLSRLVDCDPDVFFDLWKRAPARPQ
jgi:hypothetical protein